MACCIGGGSRFRMWPGITAPALWGGFDAARHWGFPSSKKGKRRRFPLWLTTDLARATSSSMAPLAASRWCSWSSRLLRPWARPQPTRRSSSCWATVLRQRSTSLSSAPCCCCSAWVSRPCPPTSPTRARSTPTSRWAWARSSARVPGSLPWPLTTCCRCIWCRPAARSPRPSSSRSLA